MRSGEIERNTIESRAPLSLPVCRILPVFRRQRDRRRRRGKSTRDLVSSYGA